MKVGILIYRSIDCTKVRMPPMAKGSRICKVGQTTERAPWLWTLEGRPRPHVCKMAQHCYPTQPSARGLSWACKCFGKRKGDTWKLVGIACTFKTLDGCNDDGFTIYIYVVDDLIVFCFYFYLNFYLHSYNCKWTVLKGISRRLAVPARQMLGGGLVWGLVKGWAAGCMAHQESSVIRTMNIWETEVLSVCWFCRLESSGCSSSNTSG